MKWTNEMDAVLKRCRMNGLSCSQTASVLFREIGVHVTRNSVIGRACRIGLPHIDGGATKVHAIRANRKKSRMAAPRVPRAKIKPLSFVPTQAEPVPEPLPEDIPTKTFDELEWNDGCCRWRVDKPIRNQPYGFCGKETLPGLSVCRDHAARQYRNWDEIAPKYVKAPKPEMETA